MRLRIATTTPQPTRYPSQQGNWSEGWRNALPSSSYPASVMVGMARRAVPVPVVAGGTNFRATLAIEGVAPLHAARTSQRDVPTTLNTYMPAAPSNALRLGLRRRSAAFLQVWGYCPPSLCDFASLR